VGFVKVAEVSCSSRWFRPVVQLKGAGQDREIAFGGLRLPFFDRHFDLWSQDSRTSFRSAFRTDTIAAALDERMFEDREPLVLRVGSGDEARVPWEAFQAEIHPLNRHKLAPLRTVDQDRNFGFGAVSSRMRVLALVGHPGAERAFDPRAAQDFLAATLSAARASSGRIERFELAQLRDDTLDVVATCAEALQPNVVIYFGHGRRAPGPEVRTAAGENGWMTVSVLAHTLFAASQTGPPFWIFWACSLGEDENQPSQQIDGSAALSTLRQSGGVAVLAMRSRIRVRAARPMLEALLGSFASGEPLEVAAAVCRAAAISADTIGDGRMDYAAPAVWSLSEPVDAISWGDGPAFPASWVAVRLLSGGSELPALGNGLAPVDEASSALAQTWSRPGRYFATTGSAVIDAASRSRLLSVGAAIRHDTGRPAVPILPRGGATFDRRLRLWAEDAVRQLDPRHHDREIAHAIGAIRDTGLNGLVRILAIPDIVLLLGDVPDTPIAWEVLGGAAPGSSIVVAGSAPPDAAWGWAMDQLMPNSASDQVEAIARAVPLGSAILSVSERALAMNKVARVAGVDAGLLDQLDPFCVRVAGQRVLAETARRRILECLPPETIAAGRRSCINLLLDQPVAHDFGALIEVVRHYVALKEGTAGAEAVNAAWLAAGRGWTVSDRSRLFDTVARSRTLLDSLHDAPLLTIVEAAILLQKLDLARTILDRRDFRAPGDRARKHAMLSECFKADVARPGSQAAMRRQAEEAVVDGQAAVDGGVPGAAVELLQYQLNLARIRQYFDHDYTGALANYEAIRDEIRPLAYEDRVCGHLFAAACRNAAECVLDPAPRPIDGDTRDRAEALVREGLEVARARGLAEIEIELSYTRARIAEAASDDQTAAAILTDLSSGQTARRYPLVAAIAANRLAWNDVRTGRRDFIWEDQRARLRALRLFEHAWAQRVVIKSRIRCARCLATRGAADRTIALALLEENRADIQRLPGLTGNDDACRAAETAAGFAVLAGADGRMWTAFLASPQAAKVPDLWKRQGAAEIWEGRG
jgi:hypothetical protein